MQKCIRCNGTGQVTNYHNEAMWGGGIYSYTTQDNCEICGGRGNLTDEQFDMLKERAQQRIEEIRAKLNKLGRKR